MFARICLYVALCAFGSTSALAEDYLVRTQAEYFAAADDVEAGDTIILANGEWRDFEITLTGRGTAAAPITLRSEQAGQVFITGRSNLRLGGEYMVVSGLVFRDGSSPTGEVLSFRRSSSDLASNSRMTEIVLDGFSKLDRYENDYWVGIYGSNNRFDHNYLAGKTNKGVTLAVRLNDPESRQNNHRIDHNYFGKRPVLGSNGGETLRVGTSQYSMYDSNTLIENNYFEETDGEVEIISIKSGRNIVRGNVFDASQGAVTLRHGDGNIIERNVFLGRGKDHTGGIRVINADQIVRDNYMEGLRGSGFSGALTVMNGVPNSPVNRYVQVSNSLIDGNTVLDSYRITLGAGADEERSAAPVDTSFANNLLSGTDQGTFLEVDADVSGIAFTGNRLISGVVHSSISSLQPVPTELQRAANGLLYPTDPALANVGAPRDLAPVSRAQTGPDWYPKPESGSLFGAGKVINVAPGEGTIEAALIGAVAGDVLQLANGEYLVDQTINVNFPLTIRGPAANDALAQIAFERPSLFEMAEGGSLRLQEVTISGSQAPDNVGNNVVRTSAAPIRGNFVLEFDRVVVSDLTVNRNFDVIVIGKSAFADSITITDSAFENITGTVIRADAETEDFGQYGAEYIRIDTSSFTRIGTGALDIYRGGRDESTFGPHIYIANSEFTDVGSGGSAMLLHGAQDTRITGNSFTGSGPLHIIHTVGTPETVIADNSFDNADAILAEELNYPGEPRIVMSGNTMAGIPATQDGAPQAGQSLPSLFASEMELSREFVDSMMDEGIVVPVPSDPGGGYTHEQHKRNYSAIYLGGDLYRITGDEKYRDYVRDMLLEYAELYPTLGDHPAKANQNVGRLFWQVLNDAMWLVYSVQGYEAIRDTLEPGQRELIDDQVFRKAAHFLSVDSERTFNLIHNHATWATAGVGMTGYLLGDRDLVDIALLGSDKSGNTGFLKQAEMLFSPDGYYAEGPYYQRFALLPFVVFADKIEQNEPDRAIFEYRDGILLKAISTTIQLSYAGYFFPFNDALKDKGLRTNELYEAVAIAYAKTRDPGLLSIAEWQGRTVLSENGLLVAQDLAAGLAQPFDFRTMLLSDGPNGDLGAVAIMRTSDGAAAMEGQALIAKNSSQGMGHGHFDKLSWQFYDNGHEIVTDYGAARFLNIEAKQGGRYLPENESWGKHTIAHNTLVVDERSHFNADEVEADLYAPQQLAFINSADLQLSTATIDTAYADVAMTRTMALVTVPGLEHPLVVDLLRANSASEHTYDLPMHYMGHIMRVGFDLTSHTQGRPVLGTDHGYQHIWVDAEGAPAAADNAFVTWLLDGRFYSYRWVPQAGSTAILAESGANDPDFNLRREPMVIQRVTRTGDTSFVSVLEPHGKFDGAAERTTLSDSQLAGFAHRQINGVDLITITTRGGAVRMLAVADGGADTAHQITVDGKRLRWTGAAALFDGAGMAIGQ